MADINKIRVDGVEYDVEDATAREQLDKLPVSVDEAGFTDITGLRRAVSYAFVRSGKTVTLTVTLEGGAVEEHSIALDNDDWPTSITTNSHAAGVTWEGF